MIKIEHQLINLKAGIPYDIFPKGGVNFYNTEVHFRYASSAYGKEITLSFMDANGQKVSKKFELKEGGYTDFHFEGELALNLSPSFGFVQFLSKEDLNIEVWAEEPEATFS